MKVVPGSLRPTGAPFAEIIGEARDSVGSNWRRNHTRAIPAGIGGTCDIASATVGPGLQHRNGLKAMLVPPVSARRPIPTSIGITSRILGVISLTSRIALDLRDRRLVASLRRPARHAAVHHLCSLSRRRPTRKATPVVHGEMCEAGMAAEMPIRYYADVRRL